MSKVIKMFYELKDANSGELLESNIGGQEIAFVSGKNQVLDALENGVLNLEVGQKATIKIPASQGVGEYDENALQVLPKEQFAGIDLNIGMELFGEGEDGSTVRVTVKAIGENDVTVDFNHPYAGKDLEFNVQITENRDADADEELTGVVAMPHVSDSSRTRRFRRNDGGRSAYESVGRLQRSPAYSGGRTDLFRKYRRRYGNQPFVCAVSYPDGPVRRRTHRCPDHAHHHASGNRRIFHAGTGFRSDEFPVFRKLPARHGNLRTACRPDVPAVDDDPLRNPAHNHRHLGFLLSETSFINLP